MTHPPGVNISESIFNKFDGSLKGTFNFLTSPKKFKVSLPLLYTTENSLKKDFPNSIFVVLVHAFLLKMYSSLLIPYIKIHEINNIYSHLKLNPISANFEFLIFGFFHNNTHLLLLEKF